MDWFSLTLVSVAFFGFQKFLFKVAAERGYAVRTVTTAFMGTVAAIATLLLAFTDRDVGNARAIVLLALANGTTFLAATLFRFHALRRLPGTVAYPLFELSIGLVVGISIMGLNETLSSNQGLGIVLGAIAALLLSRTPDGTKSDGGRFSAGILLCIGAIVAGAATQVIAKIAAITSADILLFIAVTYAWNYAVLSAARWWSPGEGRSDRTTIGFGVLVGIVNFLAFYAEIQAMKTGPLSVITVLSSFSMLIAVGLSAWTYGERFSRMRLWGGLLAFVSVLLIGWR